LPPSFFAATHLHTIIAGEKSVMTQILWLASYPKSGNTWLRAFLANYLLNTPTPQNINSLSEFAFGDMRADYYEQISGKPQAELSWPEINGLRPRVHRHLADAHPGTVLVKTHNVLSAIDDIPTITPDVTFGAIYVVRNPLDVAVSFSHHYGLTLDQGARAICYKPLEIQPKAGHILQVVSDWSSNIRTWLNAPGLYLKILKYEEMKKSPSKAFSSVLEFLKIPKEKERLKRAIRHSSFKVLAGQERQTGFIERSQNAERFFRKGAVGTWRQELAPEQVDLIVDCHKDMMREMGYLSADGKPVASPSA